VRNLGQRTAVAAAVLLCAAACGGGSGEGLDANGRPLPPGGGAAPVGLQPTLASIQSNVFSVSCAVSGCHGGGTVQAGLRLEPGFSGVNVIGVASSQDASRTRVIPGNPNASFLIQKLEGTQTLGERMPQFGPYLSQATIDVIRQWILAGAPT
jgi:hypothetical protein